MTIDYASATARMLELLGDADELRYSAQMTDAGLRAALSEYSRYLPRLLTLELEISQSGREQALGAWRGCLCERSLRSLLRTRQERRALHGVSACLGSGQVLDVHFGGAVVPVPGQRLRVRCGAAHTASGVGWGSERHTAGGRSAHLFGGRSRSLCPDVRIAVLSEVSGLRPGILRDLRELAAVHRS